MTDYVKAEGLVFPYRDIMLRKSNLNTSFPKEMTDATRAAYGVYPCTVDERPAYDEATQVVSQDAPTETSGVWSIGWTVRDKTPEELATDVEKAASSARKQRDRLLSETDWVIIQTQEQRYRGQSNVVPSQSFLDYRQALRDITNQVGFPFTIEWPVKP